MKLPMTAKEIDDILKAAACGESIEMNSLGNDGSSSGWLPKPNGNGWCFSHLEYRVKNPFTTVIINHNYTATIDPINKTVKIGCVSLDRGKLREIHAALGGI